MNKVCKARRGRERGIALLIAIFVLLLISVVAIALLVSSGTETALGSNYRASSTVYYAAMAGLEEARGRLLPKNPTYFNNTDSNFIPTPFPLGYTRYVINRLSGDNVVPWDPSNTYYDNEYQSEFNQAASSASWQSIYSVWDYTLSPSLPGPMYKWVRITAATEQSLYLDVDSDGVYDHTIPIYYNPAQVDSHGNPAPSLIKTLSPPSTAVQVLQITALAYLPNGTQKMLQYVVAPAAVNLTFPAALTLDGPNIGNPSVGNNAAYPLTFPYGATFFVNGLDQYGVGSCSPSNSVRAIGYTVNTGGDPSGTNLLNAIPTGNYGEYPGVGSHHPPPPDVNYVGGPSSPSLASNLQTVGGVNSVVTTLTQTADVVVSGPANSSVMPAAMSPSNPMTVVVNGDLDLTGWTGTGYGVLLVTGTFTYDPNASWNGIILVIGKGIFTSQQGYQGINSQISGAVLVAATVDGSGNPLSSLGSPAFDFNGVGSKGIFYSSCWVQFVQSATKYQVLSFHEIPQS
jgi:Tfp pilus assembly protein PilX